MHPFPGIKETVPKEKQRNKSEKKREMKRFYELSEGVAPKRHARALGQEMRMKCGCV